MFYKLCQLGKMKCQSAGSLESTHLRFSAALEETSGTGSPDEPPSHENGKINKGRKK